MSAAQEFVVDAFVARAAVTRRQMCADHEAVVIHFLLILGWLMAVQASHSFLCMLGHLVLMHHRVLCSRVTLCALSRSANKVGRRLLGFNLRSSAVDEKCGQDKRERNDDCHEH
jgi:hypothetical protein